MDDSGGKCYSRARGRIAEVLADARASLMEPSRPFTPASLDQRTSLSNVNSLDKHGKCHWTFTALIVINQNSLGNRLFNKKAS